MNALPGDLNALARATTGVFHDLRNVLATMELSLERLAKTGDSRACALADRLRQHVELAELISQAGAQIVAPDSRGHEPRWISLLKVVDRACRLAIPAEESAVTILVEASDYTYARELPLRRVLYNLLANSANSGPGTITVAVARESGRAALFVRDCGPGLPLCMRSDPFAIRTRDADGLRPSIGLWLARELMRAEGGDVELESTGCDGTVFAVVLPKYLQREQTRCAGFQ